MAEERVDFISNADFIRRLSSETGYSYKFTERNVKLVISALRDRFNEYDSPAFIFPKFGVMYLKIPLLRRFINTSLKRHKLINSSDNQRERLGNMIYNFENKIVPKLDGDCLLQYKESKVQWYLNKLKRKGLPATRKELERRQNKEYEKNK